MKYTTDTFHVIDYHDFDNFIKEHYGVDYSFGFDHESSNDTTHSFYGVEKNSLDDFDKEELENFKKGDTTMFICTLSFRSEMN